jgi:hypothetical protein
MMKKKVLGGSASPLRPALFPPLSSRLVDQKIIEPLSRLDRGNKPERAGAATCPCLSRGTTIFWRNFSAFQGASASPGTRRPVVANCSIHLLQLLFDFCATFQQAFINPLTQIHQRFKIHSGQMGTSNNAGFDA